MNINEWERCYLMEIVNQQIRRLQDIESSDGGSTELDAIREKYPQHMALMQKLIDWKPKERITGT